MAERMTLALALAACLCLSHTARAQGGGSRDRRPPSRLARLVEANVVATHAYQVLLARSGGKAATRSRWGSTGLRLRASSPS